jgi:meso-butanediol dehydrogenase / (S,S)-butanediol dehydrogenase / diacetyl reductase
MMGLSGLSTTESPIVLLRHDGVGAGPLGAAVAEALREAGSRCADVVASSQGATHAALLAELRDRAACLGAPAGVLIDPGAGRFSRAEEDSAAGYGELAREPLAFAFAGLRAARDLLEPEGGAIVLLTSTASWTGLPYAAATSVLHAGVENLVKSLAVEWAAFGIRLVGVAAGAINVEGAEDHPMAGEAPLGRGHASDLAAAVRFLVSPSARFITGATLVVDGGLSCRTL